MLDTQFAATAAATGGRVWPFDPKYIFVVSGHVSPSQTWQHTLKYSTAADSWESVNVLPSLRTNLDCGLDCGDGAAAAATIGNTIYVVGGRQSLAPPGEASSANEYYAALTDVWTSAAPVPSPRFGLGVTVSAGRLLAVGGAGPTDADTAALQIFTPSVGWTTRMPGTTCCSGPHVVADRTL